MKRSTNLFIDLFSLFRGGFGNAMAGLASVQKAKGSSPDDCVHFRMAENRFYSEGEYEKLYEICKLIVDDYEQRS